MRISDWSSDVCSSDLGVDLPVVERGVVERGGVQAREADGGVGLVHRAVSGDARMVLGHALAAAERGLTLVAAACVDARELHHDADVAPPCRLAVQSWVPTSTASAKSARATPWAMTRARISLLPYLALNSPPRAMPMMPVASTPSVTNMAISRSEEHTSELQSLMRISYAVFCLKKKK